MKLGDLTRKEAAGVIRRRLADAARKLAGPKLARREARPRAHRDADFKGWIHEQNLSCVACCIEGPAACVSWNPIEAAHQWIVKGPMKGVRTDDSSCVPLCRWHHQLAPNACDKGQRKFWDRLGVEIGDLCRDLYAAFQARGDGEAVIRRYAGLKSKAARLP